MGYFEDLHLGVYSSSWSKRGKGLLGYTSMILKKNKTVGLWGEIPHCIYAVSILDKKYINTMTSIKPLVLKVIVVVMAKKKGKRKHLAVFQKEKKKKKAWKTHVYSKGKSIFRLDSKQNISHPSIKLWNNPNTPIFWSRVQHKYSTLFHHNAKILFLGTWEFVIWIPN